MIEIYGTLGPACADQKVIQKMLEEGMSGMRLNLSHGSLKDNAHLIRALHEAEAESSLKAELLIDMQGPEIRIHPLKTPVSCKNGETLVFSCRKEGIGIDRSVFEAVEEGDEILLDDGKIACTVSQKDSEKICAYVQRGGILQGRKSLKIVGKDLRGPVLTETDIKNIQCAKAYGVTGIMEPFVKDGEQLKELRKVLKMYGCEEIRIFAKIENQEGIRNLDSILPEADMIVIARGDLGNDMPLWELPAAQEEIAETCRRQNRAFLVVTQMLASMVSQPVPTRAEVSDIFRAVQQGADALMVTNETAVGSYPAEVIRYLTRTAQSAEAYCLKKRGLSLSSSITSKML